MLNLPPQMLMIAGLAFVAFVAMGVGLFVFVNPFRSAKDRLEDLTSTPAPTADVLGSNPFQTTNNSSAQVDAISKALSKVAAPTDEDEANALRRRLIQAGYRSRNNVELFSTVRFTLAVMLPTTYALLPSQSSTFVSVAIALLLASFGYYVPALLVTNTLQKRQDELMRTFPDALDMLTASVEAGLGLDAAFRRVAEEMDEAAPILCAEIRLVNSEIAAGVPRTSALQHLADRTGLDELKSLVNVLVQAERFGTPVARSLRIHSSLTRTKRMQQAEEQAAKISPKLTVAMIFFMLPCLILILLGPAIVRVIRQLLPAMAGGG
ncbi:MAG: type II secretion system F family protein [Alphaproteobacteria bacterium]|nr:type II secretion system F family protein [Alphaproteobacteria bacterium]MCB9793842.1 type II secretion system F family protein [Alphaproteobacteria bacterium]